ncbi:TetR/AcrR family transcriptional regulator [Polyangium aurulentum]|uniref:TetR/AcrR family transcriptional regulator n=1 Tax=Polyangium aurulentum TaxID=2567896 RepID=UPI0010AEE860|nr:TetR/AcrR family transcriptional regulator [Polyangium aurulentum]UQA57874.1 TetR/AcrR family transcriptional regulator [Polyangium aurulentum]
MPHETYARIDPSVRKRLSAAAIREFAAHGLADASLNEILIRARVGKSSFYYYFADKEDLFASMIESVYDSVEAQLPPFAFEGNTREGFWDAVEAHQLSVAAALGGERHGMDLFRALQPLRHSPSPRLAATFARIGTNLLAVIRVGRARGFVRDDVGEEILMRLVEGADAALDARVLPATENQLKAHLRLAHDTMRRLLEAKGDAA